MEINLHTKKKTAIKTLLYRGFRSVTVVCVF